MLVVKPGPVHREGGEVCQLRGGLHADGQHENAGKLDAVDRNLTGGNGDNRVLDILLSLFPQFPPVRS